MRFIFSSLITLGFLLAPALAKADQIQLKNGDVISGTVVEKSQNGFMKVQTRYGVLDIPWADIVSFNNQQVQPRVPQSQDSYYNDLADYQPVQDPNADRYVSRADPQDRAYETYTRPRTLRSVTEQGIALQVEPKPEVTEEAVQKEEETQEELSAADALISTDVKWSGEINIGAQLRRGNSDQDRLNVDGKVELRRPKDRMIASFEVNQNEDNNNNTTTEDDRSLELIYDYFLSGKWFLQGRAEFEQDDVANLDQRTILQPSLGYQFYESDPLNLKVTGGLNFQNEEFSNGDSEDSVGAAWSLDYDQQIWENLKVFHNHDITAPFDDFDAYLFESKTGIKSPVFGALDATAEIDFDFDNAPAVGARKNDVIYRLKLGYSW